MTRPLTTGSGWSVVDRTFTDRFTGGSRENRTGSAEVLDYVREGDTVRVASMDRFARSVVDPADIVQQCADKGVAVELWASGSPSPGTKTIRTRSSSRTCWDRFPNSNGC